MKHANRDRFSVMTLNLRFGLADDGPNSWRFRIKRLPKLFQAYPVDFIACQEVNDFQREDLCALLNDYDHIGRREPAPSFWQDNIIFFRKTWRVQNADHFYLSDTPDIPSRLPSSKWPRQCTMATFEKHSRSVTCINTHFDFLPSVQVYSARLIMRRLGERSHPLPAVLMGDFNAPFNAPPYRIFLGKNRPKKPSTLTFSNVFKTAPCGTYHGFTGKPGKDCIDWILYTRGIAPETAMVVRDHVNGAYFSDHFPVVAKFVFE